MIDNLGSGIPKSFRFQRSRVRERDAAANPEGVAQQAARALQPAQKQNKVRNLIKDPPATMSFVLPDGPRALA